MNIKLLSALCALLLASLSISAQQVIRIDVQINQLIAIPATDEIVIWGSLPETSPLEPQLLVFDANNGALKRSIAIENYVVDMDYSPAGNQLVLAISTNDASVQEVRILGLPNYEEINRFPVGATTFAQSRIRAVACSPTDANIIALILDDYFQSSSSELKIYRNGDGWGESASGFYAFDQIAFRADGRAIYTKNNRTSSETFRFYRLANNDELILNESGYIFNAVDGRYAEYNGRLFSPQGGVVDISGDSPTYVGRHSIYPTRLGETAGNSYQAILTDAAANELILLEVDEGQLVHSYYDADRLHLVRSTRSALATDLPYDLLDNPIASLGHSGPHFAAHTSNAFYIFRSCEATLPPPTFDPPLAEHITICRRFDMLDTLRLAPPAGFEAIYTQDGKRWDTLSIYEEGRYHLQLIDESGCLSLPTTAIELSQAEYPAEPIITGVISLGMEPLTEEIICEGGVLYFEAEYEWGDPANLYWSNGGHGKSVKVEEAGPLWLDAITPEGCKTPARDTLDILASSARAPEPPQVQAPNENLDFCGLNSLPLEVAEGAAAYEWKTNNIWRLSYHHTFNLLDSWMPIDIRVRIKDQEGCWSDYQRFAISDSPGSGNTSIINPGGNNMLTVDSPGTKHQWFYEGQPIPNSDVAVWRARLSGSYQVRRKYLSPCWSPLSEPFQVEP